MNTFLRTWKHVIVSALCSGLLTATGYAAPGIPLPLGEWRLVRATITPEFVSVPIPVNMVDATGHISPDSSCVIDASASFLGKRYDFSGRGSITVKGNQLSMTLAEGMIAVDGRERELGSGQDTIESTFSITAEGLLKVQAVKEANDIAYTFDLELTPP
ncbi:MULTISPECIES: hypothetical protein [Prosthecochloris]|uniref:Lipocalin-like domain-containing protein n=1 Tax=Prosthecochloris vibrioformis TaxID=1098 RepID=A0A5C4S013_PROVB|nr:MULTISPECIES: hypothetical protein [Prosthecochloris]ANT64053.1 hypothetical protein Ptc2401_00245 [Prosthecochloris sp. CIB 2401]TNJ36337.1 hypothetical protein FGF68_07615 [Prosthecochloris vibrioformis]